jgi:hypothetical protein
MIIAARLPAANQIVVMLKVSASTTSAAIIMISQNSQAGIPNIIFYSYYVNYALIKLSDKELPNLFEPP